jgi:hypothetical protein
MPVQTKTASQGRTRELSARSCVIQIGTDAVGGGHGVCPVTEL